MNGMKALACLAPLGCAHEAGGFCRDGGRSVCKNRGQPSRLFYYLPPALLRLGANVLNKPGIYQRICGSLQLDIAKTINLLGWTPPVSVDKGFRRAVERFRP